jgi:hypothetical protein
MKAIFLADAHLKSRTDPGFERCMLFFDGLRGRGTNPDGPDEEMGCEIDLLVIAGRGKTYPIEAVRGPDLPVRGEPRFLPCRLLYDAVGNRGLSRRGGTESGRSADTRFPRRWRGSGKPAISGVTKITEEPLCILASAAASPEVSLVDCPVQLGDEPRSDTQCAGETGQSDAPLRCRKVSSGHRRRGARTQPSGEPSGRTDRRKDENICASG